MEESVALAKVEGHYKSFKGSPFSQDKFKFDLRDEKSCTNIYNCDNLR